MTVPGEIKVIMTLKLNSYRVCNLMSYKSYLDNESCFWLCPLGPRLGGSIALVSPYIIQK